MKSKIYLFRHAQTYFNKNRIFTGWKDSKLTSQGIRQAKVLAKKLKNKKIDVAFQTSLSRSQKTLKEILKYHPECMTKITDDRMIERSYGELQGKLHKTIIAQFGKRQFDIWHRSYDKRPPKGESIKDVETRVNEFIRYLISYIKKNKVNVCISAHGNSMRPFRKHFAKLSTKKMLKLENQYDD